MMTTTVTVKTHGRPAMAIVKNDYHGSEPTSSYCGNTLARTFIGPDDERQFVVTDTQTVFVYELPEGATTLPGYMPPADDD